MQVTVNGRSYDAGEALPQTTALEWLRAAGLTGAKEGCAEGECGACAVLVARPSPSNGLSTNGTAAQTEWTAVNACLVPVAALDGQEVVTAEGLGTSDDLHPVQHELAVRGGSQCGYCTPGFVCSMAAEYYRADRDDFDLHAIGGNLCRCTGYRPIRDAACALGPRADDALTRRTTQPPPAARPTRTAGFVRPATLAEVFMHVNEHPDAQVVAGATDWGVEVNLRGARAPMTIAVDRLEELREWEATEDHLTIGAALTLTEVERRLAGRIPMLAQMLELFASRLIRNSATLGGNLATASPIGDAAPALLALDAEVVLAGPQGDRTVPLDGFFTGYRETVRAADELIRAVRIPLPAPGLTAFHKIAKRRLDDISSVAMGFGLDIADGHVRRARIGLGGVAATPLRARAAEAALVDQPWTDETVRRAARVLADEGTPMDDHRASAAYRSAMLGQSLLKLFHESTPEAVQEVEPV